MLLRRGDLKNSWLLAPGEVLEGTRLATVRLRPVRAALLVPERSTKAAAAAVDACCLSWGGFANCIVPYSKDEGIRDPWREIVETLDPDLFVCFGDEPPAQLADYVRNRGYHHVFPYEPEGFETLVTGTLIYSALDAFMNSRDIERKSSPLVLPLYRGFPEALLAFQARYGSMLETTGFHDEKYVHNLLVRDGAQLTATHRDFFDIRECQAREHYNFEVPKMISEVFVGDLGRLLPENTEDTETRITTLPEVTLAGITRREPRAGAASPAESRKHDAKVVVLGDYTSVDDLALFWSLRAMRPGGHPFPLWLPYRHVYDDRAKELIESASRELAGRRRHSGGSLHITSASLSLDYLEERFRPLFPEADITIDIADFVGGTTDYYVVEERQPVTFVEGTAHVSRIRPAKMEGLQPDFDYVVHEVEIEGVKLPPIDAVQEAVFGVPGRGNRVLTEKGGIRTVDPHKSVYPGKDYLEIRLPDGGRLLEAFFEHYGYECLPTAKSRAALGQMGLLGGVEGINVVANSKVYGALKDLCGTREGEEESNYRPYRADRKAEPYNYFTNAFGNQNARPILNWLVENRLLLRGSNIACPRCRLELWYAVDRVGERWACDGCREEMPIPIKPDALHWRYRVNELWANGQDQGTVTPLLALYTMCARWGSTFAREGFGYYPGVELKRSEDSSVPVDHIEVDLMALYEGRLVLVECKESADHLWTPHGADEFADQLMDQIKLAEHVGARKIIIASPSRFPEDKSRLMSKVSDESSKVEVEWWDDEALLDPLYLAGDMKANDAQRWHLEWLAGSLAARSER